MGDPKGALAERGARYLAVWIEGLVDGYRAAKDGEKMRHQMQGMKKA